MRGEVAVNGAENGKMYDIPNSITAKHIMEMRHIGSLLISSCIEDGHTHTHTHHPGSDRIGSAR